jgi:hypothetical protein
MSNENENPYAPQPHILHEKRSGAVANMHRLVVDGKPGKWVRAYDEFAFGDGGYAARPWNCPLLPVIFQYKTAWATEVNPKQITEKFTDSEIGFDKGKPQ